MRKIIIMMKKLIIFLAFMMIIPVVFGAEINESHDVVLDHSEARAYCSGAKIELSDAICLKSVYVHKSIIGTTLTVTVHDSQNVTQGGQNYSLNANFMADFGDGLSLSSSRYGICVIDEADGTHTELSRENDAGLPVDSGVVNWYSRYVYGSGGDHMGGNNRTTHLNNILSVNYTLGSCADITAPTITISTANGSVQKQVENVYINGTATDDTAIDVVWVNDTRFTINASGTSWSFVNNTLLSNDYYHLNISANDTSGNVNSTYGLFHIYSFSIGNIVEIYNTDWGDTSWNNGTPSDDDTCESGGWAKIEGNCVYNDTYAYNGTLGIQVGTGIETTYRLPTGGASHPGGSDFPAGVNYTTFWYYDDTPDMSIRFENDGTMCYFVTDGSTTVGGVETVNNDCFTEDGTWRQYYLNWSGTNAYVYRTSDDLLCVTCAAIGADLSDLTFWTHPTNTDSAYLDDIQVGYSWRGEIEIADAPAVDSTAPTFDEYPQNNTFEYYSENILVDINATDETAMDRIFINDTTNFNITYDGEFKNATTVSVGTYWLNVSANDTSNNVASFVWLVYVNDTTTPTLTIANANNTGYNTDIVYINGTATDYSTLDEVYINDSRFTWNLTTAHWNFINNTNLGDGDYYFVIIVNDTYNNSGVGYVNIRLDYTDPIISNVVPTNNSYFNSAIPYYSLCSDDNIYNISVDLFNSSNSYHIGDNSTPVGTALSINGSYAITSLADGNYTWNTSCSDAHTANIFSGVEHSYSDGTVTFTRTSDSAKLADIEFGYYSGGQVNKLTSTQIQNYNVNKIVNKLDDRYEFGAEFDLPNTDFIFGFRFPKMEQIKLYDEANAHFIIRERYWIDFILDLVIEGTSYRQNTNLVEGQDYYYIYWNIDWASYGLNTSDRVTVITRSIGGLNIVWQDNDIVIDTTAPSVVNVSFLAINSSKQIIGIGQDAFNFSNIPDIEYMNVTWQLKDTNIVKNFSIFYTANGTDACALGNNQSSVCYNYTDDDWIKYKTGINTGTFNDIGGQAQGDGFICTSFIDGDYTNYSCQIDEHYNPNVFKHYPLNFSNVKWQSGAQQRIKVNTLWRINLTGKNIPTRADYYKLDFRVNTTIGTTPTDALLAFLCNTSYDGTAPVGNINCILVASKLPSELQDDGTKFRGIFTENLTDELGNIGYIVLESDNVASGYYAPKTYQYLSSESIITDISTNNGASWSTLSDGYETEININWFHIGHKEHNATQILFKFESEDNTGNIANSSIYKVEWLNDTIGLPPLVDIITPLDGTNESGNMNITWIVSEPNADKYRVNVSIDGSVIYSDLTAENTTVFYDSSLLSDGTYTLVIEACENETTEKLCGNDTHSITIDNPPAAVGGGGDAGGASESGSGDTLESLSSLSSAKQAEIKDECSKELPLFDRLTSPCVRPDNGICDDGEYIIRDRDCIITAEKLKSGEIFKDIWMAKTLLLSSVALLVFKPTKDKRIMAMIILALVIFSYVPAIKERFVETFTDTTPQVETEIVYVNQVDTTQTADGAVADNTTDNLSGGG